MRINNPKSIVGYQRADSQSLIAYNLATVGQVKVAIKDLQDTILEQLRGDIRKGNPGNGYAWLNGEGKVDVSLLPALAITDTHVVDQTELKSVGGSNDNVNEKLNVWLWNKVNGDPSQSFQKGDIIIVSVATGDTPDPAYAGSYIITKVPDTASTGDFEVSKLAYTDGKIVKINGVVPSNSAGQVHLYLKHILQQRYIDKFVSATSGSVEAQTATQKLEDTVYRLVTLDEGNDGYRFAFVDDSNAGQGAVVPYTKLAEFTAEKVSTADRFTAVNTAIASLTAKHNAELSALTLQHNNETSFLSGVIGKTTDAADSALSASIFAQTKKLRNDVDSNYQEYKTTESLTNDMLALINNNVKNLHQGLEKRAVRIYMQDFVWASTEATLNMYDLTSAEYMYQVSSSSVSGVITWTHTHSPLNTGVGAEGAYDAQKTQGLSNVDSQERVLGVYDEDGNLINVDLKFIKVGANGLNDTQISIDTEYIGRDANGKFLNSLEGKKWTLLIAKTISGIDINTVLQNV